MEPEFNPSAPFRFRRGGSLRGQMMKMLRYSGLAVLVVCIAAFASGCGGGGGGGTAEEMPPPVMECPQGQVGTYPDCMDPGPTDEQRIAAARETLAGIVNQANGIEQAARAAVTAVEASADATVEQIANARSQGNTALDALRAIVRASGVANAATTPAAAEGAEASARAALTTLSNAQSAAAAIQSAVQAVANLREQEAEEDRLATNGSSLIQHVRDNKLVYEGVLNDLGLTGGSNADPLVIGATSAGSNSARFPANDTTSRPTVIGVRGVTAESIPSDSKTPALSGTARLPYGFELKAGTKFVNVYTDITQTRKNVSLRRTGNNPATDSDGTTEPYNHVYSVTMDVADTDYLLAGIWLDGNVLKAFAYGSQPLGEPRNNNFLECLGVPQSTSNPEVTCTDVTSFSNISDFVGDGKDVSATYTGDANGAYLAGGSMSYFEADVTLNAEFNNPTGTDNTVNNGSIEGEITNIVAGGKSIPGSIELQKHDFSGDAIGAAFGDDAIGVVAGKSYSGLWKGQFFGQRVSSAQRPSSDPLNTDTDSATSATTFSALAPGSVAGTFYVKQQSNPVGSTAFIGSFAAERPRP